MCVHTQFEDTRSCGCLVEEVLRIRTREVILNDRQYSYEPRRSHLSLSLLITKKNGMESLLISVSFLIVWKNKDIRLSYMCCVSCYVETASTVLICFFQLRPQTKGDAKGEMALCFQARSQAPPKSHNEASHCSVFYLLSK